MPFAVFRQHQRGLLAVFAILAMVGFILSDTLPRWANSGGLNDNDLEVAVLYGKKIHKSDINEMAKKRIIANQFMATFGSRNYYGGTTQPEMINALILEHEADRLGIPGTAAFAREWIDGYTKGGVNAMTFEMILQGFKGQKIGGEELLIDIASQQRLHYALEAIAMPVVTPLDVFRNYRDQTEATSFKVVPFLAQSYMDKVGEPTATEITELYDKYKDVLPDPDSPTPGFKVPRQVKIESLSLEVGNVFKRLRAKITEDELKTYYEGRKKEFPMDRELPVDLFAGAPELTPPRYIPLSSPEIRDSLTDALARDRAREEVQETFATIREEFIDKFADKYNDVLSDIAEAKKDGSSTEGFVLPRPDDLSAVAKKYGLVHEITPLIDQREAKMYGRISKAKIGSKTFADTVFDTRTTLYEGFELNDDISPDLLGDHYLGRKIEDVAAHIAPLKDVQDQVVRAWKLEKARPLARKAADELAAKVKSEGGQIKTLLIGDRPVVSIESVTKLKAGMQFPTQVNGQFEFRRGPSSPTEIGQIPDASPALLDNLFGLKPGEVAVEADLPQSTYYVMTLEKRDPVSYMRFLGPTGLLLSYMSDTQGEVSRKAYLDGMARLREQAGYHPENYPNEKETLEAEGIE